MKRVNDRQLKRLMALDAQLRDQFSELARESTIIYRGDVRAIQWAAWWIRESILASEVRTPRDGKGEAPTT